MKIFTEIKNLFLQIKQLDRKVIFIFLSVAVLQTISWYFTSRRSFKLSFLDDLKLHQDPALNEYLYWFAGDFITFFIIPVFLIRIVLKEKIRDYGLMWGDYKSGLFYLLLFMIVMIPIIWFVSSTVQFSLNYPHIASARVSWDVFFIYQAGILLYMIGWEFFWRGFMLFGLEPKFGYYTVLIQMLPFLILHNGKPVLETFGAIPAGIALGILALRTRSVLYCVLAHSCVMFSIDLISSLRYRTNDYGTGFSSFINIFSQIF